jgi:hypothetical protein
MKWHVNRYDGSVINTLYLLIPHVMIEIHPMKKDDWNIIALPLMYMNGYLPKISWDKYAFCRY